MSRIVQLESGVTITIDEPFDEGGSGTVHKILSPASLTNEVVKLYNKEKLTKEAEQKIRYLISRELKQDEHESIIWIKDVIVENGKFIGFKMNFAKGIGLHQFLNDRWWRKNDTKDWDKFKLGHDQGLENRIRLCLNIAIAINIIHKNTNYTLADIKPSNFRVQPNGIVSIIDIDNLEVIENDKILYSAQVVTEDFSPPEFHKGLNYKQSRASQDWDRYSLAILFYNILCGIHPFIQISCKPPYEDCTNCPDLIKNGLFLYGNKSSYLSSVQTQHDNFLNLSQEIKNLLIQCFDAGHDKPQLRPSAEDWCRAFSDTEISIKRPSLSDLLNSDSNYNTKFKKAFEYNTFTSPLTLKTNLEISFPDVRFYKSSDALTLFDRIINIFKRTPKLKLIEELTIIENGLRDVIDEQPNIRSKLLAIITEFEHIQREIISKEKKLIEELKKSLQKTLENLENSVTKAQVSENNEVSELYNRINTLIQKEDNFLVTYSSSLYDDLIKSFDKQKLEYQTNIKNYEDEKKREIERMINEKNKLAHYNIEKECIKIFNSNLPSVVTSLKQLNFFTAADFLKVSSDGYLLNHSNKWIKIIGLGTERAKKLHHWRLTIEDNENNKITQRN